MTHSFTSPFRQPVPSVAAASGEAGPSRRASSSERRSPVVRVDKRQVPALVALVAVGHARQEGAQHYLAEAERHPEAGHLFDEVAESLPQHGALGGEALLRHGDESILVLRIGIGPGAVHLRLAGRLSQRFPHPVHERGPLFLAAADRRHRQERGGDQAKLEGTRDELSAAGLAEGDERPEAHQPGLEFRRHLGEGEQAGPAVGAPLGVMRRPGHEPARAGDRPGGGAGVEALDAVGAVPPRVAPDLEEGEGADEAVPGGVLDAFCHDRAAQLLKADDAIARAEEAAGEVPRRHRVDDGPVELGRAGARDVGPVHGQVDEDLGERRRVRSEVVGRVLPLGEEGLRGGEPLAAGHDVGDAVLPLVPRPGDEPP